MWFRLNRKSVFESIDGSVTLTVLASGVRRRISVFLFLVFNQPALAMAYGTLRWDWPLESGLSPFITSAQLTAQNSEAKPPCRLPVAFFRWLACRGTQSAGRGRLQRHWVSPVGNLFAKRRWFHEPGGMRVASRLPFARPCVLRRGAIVCTSAEICLKWALMMCA